MGFPIEYGSIICAPTVSGTTAVYGGVVCGTTSVCTQIVCATTCMRTAIGCATSYFLAQNICGTSCVRGPLFCSTVTTGTAPIQVTSTTLNPNLNADLLDGLHANEITGCTNISFGAAQYQIPYTNASLDDFDYNGTLTFNGSTLTVTGTICATSLIRGNTFCSTVATGSAPVSVSSTSLNANLNADLLDGYHASQLTGMTSGAGDVTGITTSLNNQIPVYCGTTGKEICNSTATIASGVLIATTLCGTNVCGTTLVCGGTVCSGTIRAGTICTTNFCASSCVCTPILHLTNVTGGGANVGAFFNAAGCIISGTSGGGTVCATTYTTNDLAVWNATEELRDTSGNLTYDGTTFDINPTSLLINTTNFCICNSSILFLAAGSASLCGINGSTAAGTSVGIIGGNSTTNNGGGVYLYAGCSTSGGEGGDVNIGSGTGSGGDGTINFYKGSAKYNETGTAENILGITSTGVIVVEPLPTSSGGDVTGTTTGVAANEIPVYQDTSGKLICTSNATIASGTLTTTILCGSTCADSSVVRAGTCVDTACVTNTAALGIFSNNNITLQTDDSIWLRPVNDIYLCGTPGSIISGNSAICTDTCFAVSNGTVTGTLAGIGAQMWLCSDIDLALKGNGGVYLIGNTNIISGDSHICSSVCHSAPTVYGSTLVCGATICGTGCVKTPVLTNGTSNILLTTGGVANINFCAVNLSGNSAILTTNCVEAPVICGTNCLYTNILCTNNGTVSGTLAGIDSSLWLCSDIDLYLKGNGGVKLVALGNGISGDSYICSCVCMKAPVLCGSVVGGSIQGTSLWLTSVSGSGGVHAAYFNSGGCLVSGTTYNGDVVGTATGVAANEIPVYQDATGKLICTSNATVVGGVLSSTVLYAGSCMCASIACFQGVYPETIEFSCVTFGCITHAARTTGSPNDIKFVGQRNTQNTTGDVSGGTICIIGGAGCNNTGSGGEAWGGNVLIEGGLACINTGGICGGCVFIRGGGAFCTTGGGAGGDVFICGGAGDGSSITGGNVDICGGDGVSDGAIRLYSATSQKFGTTSYGTCTVGCHCTSTRLYAPAITLTTGAASGCVLTSDASGNATWETPASGGVSWTGTQYANGVATYVGASTMCSEPNLTFDGSIMCLVGADEMLRMCAVDAYISFCCAGGRVGYIRGCGTSSYMAFCKDSGTSLRLQTSNAWFSDDIVLADGASRSISVAQATDQFSGDHLYICAGAADDICTTTAYPGGNLYLLSGRGSAEFDAAGTGGATYVCGGSGGVSYNCNCGGTGGNVYVCGGYGGVGNFGNGGRGCVHLDGSVIRFYVCGTQEGYITPTVFCSCNALYATTCLYSTVLCATTGIRVSSATGYKICAPSGCGCAVDWTATSDRCLKKNITPISNALSMVNCLCGVCYDFCIDNSPNIGLIAQDVEKVVPRLVTKGESEEDFKEKYGVGEETYGLKYDKFAGLFVEAIKELTQQNKDLRCELDYLKSKLDSR